VASNGARDAESALQDFDGISYAKGAAVLKQLHQYLGEQTFLAGLRSYFSDFAYGNASFADLIAHWSASVGESEDGHAVDLQAWAQSWLRTAGMDTLDVLESPPQIVINRRPSRDGAVRPHRIVVGSVDHSGAVTAVQDLVVDDDRQVATVPADSALVIPDVTDSTWAKIRFGDDGWSRLASVLESITDEPASVVIHNAVRDAVRDAQLGPVEALDLLCASLPSTRSEVILTQLLAFAANQLAGAYSPVAERPTRLARVHDLATAIMDRSEPGSDRQLAAFRACVRTSVDDQLLRGWHDETHLPPGLDLDPELLWGVVRRIVLLTGDETLIDAALGRDPSASGRNHAAQARASIPSADAKEAAWLLLMQPSELSAYELYATAEGFFDPRQTALTAGYVPRYFAEIGATAEFRSGWVLGGVATKAFPSTAATPETVQLAEQTLSRDLAAPVRRALVDATDRLRRAVASLSRFS
jgi:aminopeptidase N